MKRLISNNLLEAYKEELKNLEENELMKKY